MQKLIRTVLFFSIFVALTGCHLLNPSMMLRTKRGYKFAPFADSLFTSKDYKIATNDLITFNVYSNDGFKLIDITSINTFVGTAQANSNTYVVEQDDSVRLPVLGRIKLGGLTLRQAESFLEQKYSVYYVKPFVIIKIQNKRIIIFPGTPGTAKVLSLMNNNTKLIEAIALSGGIPENGKAHRIKLIRGNLQNPQIYLIDLSTIEGIRLADMTVQGNDIIYVDPRLNIGREIIKEIAPIISLMTTTLLVLGIVKTL